MLPPHLSNLLDRTACTPELRGVFVWGLRLECAVVGRRGRRGPGHEPALRRRSACQRSNGWSDGAGVAPIQSTNSARTNFHPCAKPSLREHPSASAGRPAPGLNGSGRRCRCRPPCDRARRGSGRVGVLVLHEDLHRAARHAVAGRLFDKLHVADGTVLRLRWQRGQVCGQRQCPPECADGARRARGGQGACRQVSGHGFTPRKIRR